MTKQLTMGEVAKRAGVPRDTVRYYERRGLIPVPGRTAAGYRDFPAETVGRIRFIKRAQELGFTLEEISELLHLREESDARCEDVLEMATQKVRLIDEKVEDLQSMKKALQRLMSTCASEKPYVECPIIESLDRNGSE